MLHRTQHRARVLFFAAVMVAVQTPDSAYHRIAKARQTRTRG